MVCAGPAICEYLKLMVAVVCIYIYAGWVRCVCVCLGEGVW